MSRAFPQPLIDLLRDALETLESAPLATRKLRRIHYLREFIAVNALANFESLRHAVETSGRTASYIPPKERHQRGLGDSLFG